MRLWSKLSALLLPIAVFAALASAEPIAELHASNYVNDFAGVLSERTTNQLNDVCRQIDEKAGAQIAVVTIHSLDGSDIESYANTLFRNWGVGDKSSKKKPVDCSAGFGSPQRKDVVGTITMTGSPGIAVAGTGCGQQLAGLCSCFAPEAIPRKKLIATARQHIGPPPGPTAPSRSS